MIYEIFLVLGAVALFSGLYFIFAEILFHWKFNREKKKSFSYSPSVSIIVPSRGKEENLEQNVKALLDQNYAGKKEYIFVVDSKKDYAYNIIKKAVKGKRNVRLMMAKLRDGCSGKNAALLTGVAKAKNDVLVFADTDAKPDKKWLHHLVSWLEKTDATTGFRFYDPQNGFFSYLRSAWNNIGLRMILGIHTFTWGGSMAVRRDLFCKLGVDKAWARSLSDDATLTHALRKAKKKIEFVPHCILFNRSETEWKDVKEFTNRQVIFAKTYFPQIHIAGILVIGGKSLLMLLGFVSLILGHILPAVLLLSLIPLELIKELIAFRGYKKSMGISGNIIKYMLAGFASTWLMTYNVLHAIGKTKVEWRGRTYRIRGREEIEII